MKEPYCKQCGENHPTNPCAMCGRDPSTEPAHADGGVRCAAPGSATDTKVETKTEPWMLEGNMIVHWDGDCQIRVGGAQMPEYHVRGTTLIEAIAALVHAVTRDAIEDEAREWQSSVLSNL